MMPRMTGICIVRLQFAEPDDLIYAPAADRSARCAPRPSAGALDVLTAGYGKPMSAYSLLGALALGRWALVRRQLAASLIFPMSPLTPDPDNIEALSSTNCATCLVYPQTLDSFEGVGR
jgi:hypothetical protein